MPARKIAVFSGLCGVAEGAKGQFLEELSWMGNITIQPVKVDKSTYVTSGPGFLNQLVNLLMISGLGVYKK